MSIKKFTGYLAGTACLLFSQSVVALPVDLGTAGPEFWAVIEIGTGKVDMSNPAGYVDGNVGIYSGGGIASSGPTIQGDLILGNNVAVNGNVLVPGRVQGDIVQDAASAALIEEARQDALAASAAALALQATVPALTVINSPMTLTATAVVNVYNLSTLYLQNEVLVLSGSATDSFVFNVTDKFKLESGGKIVLTGGLTYDNVLFNYVGTSDVGFTGGGNASQGTGILLSPNAKIAMSPGLWTGELIGGKNISIVSGAKVVNPGVRVDDRGSTWLMVLVMLGALTAVGAMRQVTE